MSVTLCEVRRAARAHRAPLAGESAGYLVLAIADQVLNAPRLVRAEQVQLSEGGALRVLSGQASSEAEAELSLRQVLEQLLLIASSGSAALTRASRRTVPLGLSSLVHELEAALIPVNRAAARRALARVHRETVRALDSGELPAEEPEFAAAPAPALLAPQADSATTGERPLVGGSAPVLPLVQEPAPESHLNGVLSALCAELLSPPELQESDALTFALEVRPVSSPSSAVARELEFEDELPLELEAESVDSGAAPTVMRASGVEPVPAPAIDDAAASLAEQAELADDRAQDIPLDACTRPEPGVRRRSLRPELGLALPPPLAEAEPHTPTLGSLAAQLPMLGREQIAQLSAEAELSLGPATERDELLLGAQEDDAYTEQMPEVVALSPAEALVASPTSSLSELVSNFQIGPDDSHQGLCRAIKEMADLELTPGPFAALLR